MVTVILGMSTGIILVVLGIQDIKEKMIYTFPIFVLHGLWCIYLLLEQNHTSYYLAVVWLIHFLIYIIFNHWNIWGAGDSDIFMLFGNICLFATEIIPGYQFIIYECLYLALALSMSIVIGRIESKVRKSNCKLDTKIAVVPGMAIVMIGLIMNGVYWRMM